MSLKLDSAVNERMFEYTISIIPDYDDLSELETDHLVQRTLQEVQGDPVYRDISRKHPEWSDEKVLKQWMKDEWVIEVTK